MNKILILSIIFVSILGFTSCEKEEIATFQESDNIYFSNALYAPNGISEPVRDSTGFSFGLDNPTIKGRIFKIPIRVQGNLSDMDRKVKLTVDPSSTAIEGTHFSLPEEIYLHAGKRVDTVEVAFFRTPDMKTNQYTLVLNLEENEWFTTKMQTKVVNTITKKTMSFIRCKITFDDKLTQPPGWYAASLGPFTAKKFFLMCELMDLEPEMFAQKLGAPGLTVPDMTYYQNFMKRYLADQKKSGNIIYEEDGTEMYLP